MPETAVLISLKCTTNTFREKEFSSFFLPKEKEETSFPKGPSFEGQRALKAFYHHRPSAPANFNFFVSKPEDVDFQMQSADSILGDLVDGDDLSPGSFTDCGHKPLPMSPSACYQIQEDVPMDAQLSLSSWYASGCLMVPVHGLRTPSMREIEKQRSLQLSRARPTSFHLVEEASRRMSPSVDWANIVPRLVTDAEECTSTSNTLKQTSAKHLKPCSVNSSRYEPCKFEINRRQSDGSAGESPYPVLPSALRFQDLDSDFLETTDDEDHIFHAPYALSCVGSMIYDAPGSRQSITMSTLTTSSPRKGLISSNGRFLQSPSNPGQPLEKKEKPKVRRLAFLRRIASKLCRCPSVKDE